MKCPVCHIDMIVVEYQRIEFDHCLNCNGVWFDYGELELLLEGTKSKATAAAELEALFTPARADTAEKKRRCPICARKMDKLTICQEPPVLIDACPRGEGLWFDGGELA